MKGAEPALSWDELLVQQGLRTCVLTDRRVRRQTPGLLSIKDRKCWGGRDPPQRSGDGEEELSFHWSSKVGVPVQWLGVLGCKSRYAIGLL